MPKALVWTDGHSHCHKDRVERLGHCLDVTDWTFRVAERHECEYIFFLGDLFHERTKIDVLNYTRTFEVIRRNMASGRFQMYALLGNHDMYHKRRWDVNSVGPLTAIDGFHVVDSPRRLRLGGRKIDWLPHTENTPETLEEFKKEHGAGDLLLGHVAVHGALLNLCYGTRADVIVEYDSGMVAVGPEVFKDWPMTLLGHYHGAQKLAHNVEYVGSPLQLNFGEAFQQKHCVVLDLDTMAKEYVVNDFSPKHLIVTAKDVEDENYDLNGHFVRLAVDDMRCGEVLEVKRHIASKYRTLSFDTKTKERKKSDDASTVIQVAKGILTDVEKMLRTYVREKGVPPGMDGDRLIARGLEYLQQKP